MPPGACARAGHQAQRQRWLYHFRNRHGFTDEADAAFDTPLVRRRPQLGRDPGPLGSRTGRHPRLTVRAPG